MSIKHNRATELANKYNLIYNALFDEILEPNQINIKLEADFELKDQLQKQHNRLCILINMQHDVFEAIINIINDLPSQQQLNWYKDYSRLLRKSIKDLGGNPSNINFSKINDLY